MAVLDQQLMGELEKAIETNDSHLALQLLERVRGLMSQVPENDISAGQAFDEVEATCMAVAMKFLAKQSLVDLFERRLYYVLALPESVDLIENLKARLVDEPFVEDRNALRQKLKASIERCADTIGKENISLGSQSVKPTVSNWVKLYVAEVGNTTATVKRARFLAQNADVKKLSLVDNTALQRLIKLYEYLKLRSDQAEGFEEEVAIQDADGNTVVLNDGKVTPLYNQNTLKTFKEMARDGVLDLRTLNALITRYPNDFKEFMAKPGLSGNKPAAVNPADTQSRAEAFFNSQGQKYAKLMHVSGVPLPNRTAALVAMLHKAMSRGQEADLVLSREILQNTVSDQERFMNFMRHTSVINLLQSEFPSPLGEKNKSVVKQSPASPVALQALLMIVFSKFKITPDEVLWHAFEVLQKAPLSFKEIKTIVSYDVGENKLAWRY